MRIISIFIHSIECLLVAGFVEGKNIILEFFPHKYFYDLQDLSLNLDNYNFLHLFELVNAQKCQLFDV